LFYAPCRGIRSFFFFPARNHRGAELVKDHMEMKSLVTSRGNPYLTMMGLSILGSVLLFLFLVLVFFARLHARVWVPVVLPPAFAYSTITILLSSAALHFNQLDFRQERYPGSFRWLSVALILGLAFALLQVAGWKRMILGGAQLSQTSDAFVFLVSGLHFLHLLLGLAGLCWMWFDSYQAQSYVEGYLHSLNPMKMTRRKIIPVFWHFLDGLWLVLFALLWWYQP
jgi:cytochrome c oxidase subunit 3